MFRHLIVLTFAFANTGWLTGIRLDAFASEANSDVAPGKVLELSRWRLTLPVDTLRSGEPDEIEQPALASFEDNLHFFSNDAADGVVFRAECGGIATKGSSFPRCELREMNADGSTQAKWNTTGATVRTMTVRLAITKVPKEKQHVVCAQIHDAEDDLMMVRLEGTKLFVERNEVGDVALNRQYVLGTPFEISISAGQGHVTVSYDGEVKLDWPVDRRGCYFKAGCYTQSNVKKGDRADDYAEVVISKLRITESNVRE